MYQLEILGMQLFSQRSTIPAIVNVVTTTHQTCDLNLL